MEKQIGDKYGSNYSGQVGNKPCGDGITGFSYSNRAEIHCNNIKGSISCALKYARQASCKRICTKGFHSVHHHAPGSGTAQGLHESGGQGIHKVGVITQSCHYAAYALHQKIHRAAGTKNSDSNQYCNQVRYDAYADLKTIFGAFNKCFVNIDTFDKSQQDKRKNNGKQNEIPGHR